MYTTIFLRKYTTLGCMVPIMEKMVALGIFLNLNI